MNNKSYTRAVAHALISISFLSMGGVAGCGAGAKSFDAQDWRAGDPEQRGTMVRDLLGVSAKTHRRSISGKPLTSRSPLYGLSKTEVLELLGPPTSSLNNSNDIFYNVGYLGRVGFDIGEFYLIIEFDEADEIEEVIVSD